MTEDVELQKASTKAGMRSYAHLLIAVFLALIAGTAGFSMLVDPYDILDGPRIAGFNAVKTRRDEDGRRVTVGEGVLKGGYGTDLFGSSHAVEGFPRTMSDAQWPGGLYNAGMRGSTTFEQARALVLAGQAPDLRCVVVGFDSESYQKVPKTLATYWISALPDGNRFLATARTSLSPNAFYRAIQTIVDNASGRGARVRYLSVYPPGVQRIHVLTGARNFLIADRGFEYDPARLEFTMTALRGLAAQGVQIIGMILPRHAWADEALYESGRWDEEVRWRHDVMKDFAAIDAANHPIAPCAADRSAAALWDFTGWRLAKFSVPPTPTQTIAQPYFYEASHFSPLIGVPALQLILGQTPKPPFDIAHFGDELTPQNLAQQEASSLQRRAEWLKTDAGRFITADFASLLASHPAPWHPAETELSRDDWQAMRRDVGRIRSREERANAIAAENAPGR